MINTIGIILEMIPYSESSWVLKLISWDKAQISVIAKGWRKKAEPLLRFVEYDFSLSEPREEGLYILKDLASLQDFSQYPATSTWAAAEAGAELLARIMIPQPEAKQYYTLLRQYLAYLQNVDKNGILIFWRLMLRLFVILGIDMKLDHCERCQKDCRPAAQSPAGDLLCNKCHMELVGSNGYEALSPQARSVLHRMPEIGRHLKSIALDKNTISEINKLFLNYFSSHHKQTLKLKSLSVLSQFY